MRAPGSRRERGQSLTELAISFVALLLVLSVGVDSGRAYFSLISLREAAEEGAIFGSFRPTNASDIIARVRSSSSTPVNLADTTNVTVAVNVCGATGACPITPAPAACAGRRLRVQVTHQFRLTMPFVGAIIGTQTIPITVSSTSTILRPPCP
ncbi:MAG: pilus assembly protein [Anaerolineales bacterium]|nr:MAG: pilus assembly protein [Anaerolineales bacterium]